MLATFVNRKNLSPQESLQEAIRRIGGQAALGRALGIKQQSIFVWDIAPVRRVLEIERLTGVSRHDLRPDIYPREPTPSPAQRS